MGTSAELLYGVLRKKCSRVFSLEKCLVNLEVMSSLSYVYMILIKVVKPKFLHIYMII